MARELDEPGELDEAWVAEAIAHHRRTERLRAELAARVGATEVSVHSPDELVEVLVSADGSVRRVVVVGPLQGRTSVEVTRSIDAALGAAADAAGWARRTLYAETFGGFPFGSYPPGDASADADPGPGPGPG